MDSLLESGSEIRSVALQPPLSGVAEESGVRQMINRTISHNKILGPLFEVPSIIQAPISDFVATADGRKFLINVPFETQNQTPLTLVINWDLRLKSK